MRRRLIVGVALALVVAPFLTGVAQAVGSCAWDSETATLTVTPLQGRHSTLRVSGQDILFDGEACAPLGATTATVDLIIVNGSVLDDTFFLEFSGGLFAPGAEVEATGVSEIEFDFELGDQTEEDSVVFGGTEGPDLFGFGVGGANLNADDDVDATFGGVEHVVANVNSGADVVAADGDVVVGGALTIPLGVSGGQGNDIDHGGRRERPSPRS